jgi:cytoskeleton protein RodZ
VPTDDAREPELTLGAALQGAREQAGLTVERLASETKIRATLIRDLEAERFASSGGNVYARGHVKSIATSLHVDAAPLLAMFDSLAGAPAALPLASQEVVRPAQAQTFGGTDFVIGAAASLRPERSGPRWGLALAGAGVILGGLVLIGSFAGGGKPASDTAIDGPTATPTPTTAQTRAPVQQLPLTAAKPPVVGAQLRVRIIGQSSWVSISNATGTLFEGILKDGAFKDFKDANRLKVVVGFAPSVSLNCGGKDSGQSGGAGTVRKFYCTSAGLTSV